MKINDRVRVINPYRKTYYDVGVVRKVGLGPHGDYLRVVFNSARIPHGSYVEQELELIS